MGTDFRSVRGKGKKVIFSFQLTKRYVDMCFNADLQIIFRDIEKELFPCLRRFGIAFYAYNPVSIAWQELQLRHQPIDPKE